MSISELEKKMLLKNKPEFIWAIRKELSVDVYEENNELKIKIGIKDVKDILKDNILLDDDSINHNKLEDIILSYPIKKNNN